jgi:mRNA-degrading endonuclease RelE of RelBE toxin-antitoxin system
MPEFWTLHISRPVARFIYTLPRGRATELRDALARLRTNPKPEGARPLVIEELPEVFEVKIGMYRIEYQMIEYQHSLRILLVE